MKTSLVSLPLIITVFASLASAQVKSPNAAQAMSELRAAHDGWNAAMEGYKFPRLLDLTPLGPDNIDDPTKVITAP